MNSIFSGRIKIYSLFILSFMSIHILFWLVMFVFFVNLLQSTSINEILYSFYLNFKFNLRLSFIALLPIVLFSIFPWNIFNKMILRKLAIFYTVLIFTISFIIYIIDISHYLYLGNRLDASVLRFLEDFMISLEFVIQSYPVFWLSLLVFIFSFVFYLLAKNIFSSNNLVLISKGKLYKAISSLLIFIIIIASIHGKISQYPLRWSEAYFSKDKDIATLSLNPILNLFDTFKYRESNFIPLKDIDKKEKLLKENIDNNDKVYTKSTKPNIIILMMESVNINRLGFVGNKLNPTPNLDKLIKNGYFWSEFFVPIRGTAQSVFTSLFGVPDVSNVRTASRNPFIKQQNSLVNDLQGYEKHYFIGGSLSWANTRGLFTKFIPSMQLFEGEYHSDYPYIDVWGISDDNLFKEAHKKFEEISSKNKPFFAYIQTAGNHRPFTIPKENKEYKIKNHSEKELNDNGFISQDYFNGVNLLDFSIGNFIEYFKNSSYYDNTIIVLFGDHGITGTQVPFVRASDLELNIYENHVPLIIYSPSLIKEHKTFNRVSYLPDMLPTIFSIAKINFKNKTLGVDLLNEKNRRRTALLVNKGLIQDNFFLKINNKTFDLYDLKANKIIYNEIKYNKMKDLYNAINDVSKNMLYGDEED